MTQEALRSFFFYSAIALIGAYAGIAIHTSKKSRLEESTIRNDLRQQIYREADHNHDGLLSEPELQQLGMDMGIVNILHPLTARELEDRIRDAPLEQYQRHLSRY